MEGIIFLRTERRTMMLKLSDRQWKPFRIGDYFNTEERGRRLTNPNRKEGKTPLVTAGEVNNGVSAFIDNDTHKQYRDAITLDMFANAFYQHWTFKCDDNITVLQLPNQSLYVHLFIVTVLKQLRSKYSYATQVRPQRLAHEKIMLPINTEGTPDWDFMHDYMYERERPKIRVLIKHLTKQYNRNANYLVEHPLTASFKEIKWGRFKIGDIATFGHGKSFSEKERVRGKIPYITATAMNNGVGDFIGNKHTSIDTNTLSLNSNGSIGYCFYHPYKAIFSTDTLKLKLQVQNKYTSLFVGQCIFMQKDKYTYGYKMVEKRIQRQIIFLPITSEGTPDWDFMETYMCVREQEILQRLITSSILR